jgi:hypothetical protein
MRRGVDWVISRVLYFTGRTALNEKLPMIGIGFDIPVGLLVWRFPRARAGIHHLRGRCAGA